MTEHQLRAAGVHGRRLSTWLLAAGLAVTQAACGGAAEAPPEEVPAPGVQEFEALAEGELWKVNFQMNTSAVPVDYLKDIGEAYNTTRKYGWVTRDTSNTPLDMTPNTRDRQTSPRLGTFIHMQGMDVTAGNDLVTTPARWQFELANGYYTVLVAVGDAGGYTDSIHRINVEGVRTVDDFIPTLNKKFRTDSRIVMVTDGKLTIDALGGRNTKLTYVDISVGNRPSVRSMEPNDGEIEVLPTTSLVASLNLPAGRVSASTLSTSTVVLTEFATGARVSGTVITSGGGDTINFTPSAPLKEFTKYRLRVTEGVKDQSANSFLPFQADFTTGALPPPDPVSFTKVEMSVTHGPAYTSIARGPDGRIYAGTLTGEIIRYSVNADGTLGGKTVLNTVRAGNGNANRYVIGLAFDPASTSTSPVLWVSHSEFWNGSTNAADWTGKISRLSGTSLGTYQDYVVGLPRSTLNHVTNSIAFNPLEPGVLYALQGSNTAMGAPDTTWGNRPERVLTAAVLRINLAAITSPPLNVRTSEGGGTYNPYATGAPLTIYASGVRNAYDLVWHSNGNLYVPTNGSASGGNTPATPTLPASCASGTPYSGPAVEALTGLADQPDLLFRIRPGRYYGHPNPRRCEYVLNGGNPTTGVDPFEVGVYDPGTLPDTEWALPAYNFGLKRSPNGVVEYKNDAVASHPLEGMLLVVRYSNGQDIIALRPGGTNGDINGTRLNITGFTNFNPVDDPILGSPLDLALNPANGYLYVTELDEKLNKGEIILLKPDPL
jgi:hypothetical protein